MTFRGHIKNGQIVFETAVSFPEGADVDVRVRRSGKKAVVKKASKPRRRKTSAPVGRHERYKDLIMVSKELPRDFAARGDTRATVKRAAKPKRGTAKKPAGKVKARTLYERLKPFIGMANGLPVDASVNHDHYLYGHPKRS